jgi:hypothetical protein
MVMMCAEPETLLASMPLNGGDDGEVGAPR